MDDPRRYAPATLRNRDPILAALRRLLPASGTVLEIASGTGEHAVFFAARLPSVAWQPSDPGAAERASIDAHAADAALPNLRPALALDVTAPAWAIARADAVLCCNMIHIAPWAATLGLMAGAARVLGPGAPLLLYGPFRQTGVPTAPSNEDFDASLRARDPSWGLRDLDAVTASAKGFMREAVIPMPANNLMVAFRRA
ncbi:DUF938 domain-containing protein [Plastoroseomonas arctica]|uniref:DUF938 domain-containing protein n=1 Tax=Plastoroseomonas arctica TaxID=1509237 RepID=A0AAF1KLU8_9PROT|nr:DUF938 domain-containing protein [Plastoroseomonas arctica]